MATLRLEPGPPSGRVLAILGGLAAAALVVAWTLQYGMGFAPCHLCLWERWPYWGVIGLALAGLLLDRPRLALALAALVLLGGAVLSFYHVGVERGLFALPASCVAAGRATTIEELRRQLVTARPTCDQVTAEFLRLSLATWNALFSLALAALAGFGALGRPGASAAEQHR
jgi:disulfide bond formation protein DsbB